MTEVAKPGAPVGSSKAGAGINTDCWIPAACTCNANDASSVAMSPVETCERIVISFVAWRPRTSTERERIRRDAGVQELDLERVVAHAVLLANQLIQAILVDSADAVGVDI